jgi:hypothetical protein
MLARERMRVTRKRIGASRSMRQCASGPMHVLRSCLLTMAAPPAPSSCGSLRSWA